MRAAEPIRSAARLRQGECRPHVDSQSHRQFVDRCVTMLAQGSELPRLDTREAHVKSKFGQPLSQQVLDSFRTGIVLTVDHVDHTVAVVPVRARGWRMHGLGSIMRVLSVIRCTANVALVGRDQMYVTSVRTPCGGSAHTPKSTFTTHHARNALADPVYPPSHAVTEEGSLLRNVQMPATNMPAAEIQRSTSQIRPGTSRASQRR